MWAPPPLIPCTCGTLQTAGSGFPRDSFRERKVILVPRALKVNLGPKAHRVPRVSKAPKANRARLAHKGHKVSQALRD